MKIYDLQIEYNQALQAATAELKRGGIVAFPTETVYGLGGVATDASAVRRIFAAKGRPADNPLIVHVASIEQARALSRPWTSLADRLAQAFWPGPISLVVPASDVLPAEVTAGLKTVGLRMPDHAFALDLIRACGPIAAPSANSSGRPSPVTAQHVADDLDIPIVLDGGRCPFSVESTVVDCTGLVPVILRPGSITREQVAGVCGACEVAQGVFEPVDGQAKSPGMLHKHYAPKGEAVVVMPGDTALAHMLALYDEAAKAGRSPVLLLAEENVADAQGRAYIPLGTKERMASGLFDALRKADAQQADYVILQGTDTAGSGLAYMNRALRAAGFRME